ncbi:hypothetical protein ASD63_21005 [Ensifer sp. Root558]|nr:hypothetical protein ASD63_21005 [Ensifer sp. Root558]
MIAPIAMAEAHAEPLSSALAKAYHNNPTLNAARAGVRASAYDIDIARSAMHPKITWRSGIGYNSSAATNRGTFGIVLDQTLFDGLQTTNNVEVNKARQRAAEENTRNTEQNILFEATEAYMDVVLTRRIVALRKQDLDFLKELTRSEIARHQAGERTRTNLAQAEARRAAAQAELSLAHAEAKRAQATYRQVIGDEPGNLTGGKVPVKMLPANIDKALAIAAKQHPALLAKRHLAEGAMFNVAVSEGKLLPTVKGAIGIGRGEGVSAIDAIDRRWSKRRASSSRCPSIREERRRPRYGARRRTSGNRTSPSTFSTPKFSRRRPLPGRNTRERSQPRPPTGPPSRRQKWPRTA